MNRIDLPDFEATWWPVQLETVPGSGERLTVALVVRARNGQATVRQVLEPPTLMGMFGTEGKGMQFVVGTTVLKLREQLDNLVAVQELQFPFGGIALGSERDCIARDVNEIFGIATRMSSGFALSAFGAHDDEDAPADAEVKKAFDEWSDKIRMDVVIAQAKDQWSHAFNVPLTLNGRKKARFGFVGGGYVAQFGVLRAGKNISQDLRALKLKLFDLEVVRRELPMQFSHAELVIGFQEPGPTTPTRQRDTLLASWEHLAHEAQERKVGALRYVTPHEAANHVLAMAAAA